MALTDIDYGTCIQLVCCHMLQIYLLIIGFSLVYGTTGIRRIGSFNADLVALSAFSLPTCTGGNAYMTW